MTVYNEAPTVRASFKSLLSQLDENYEVVVVDNFSKDGTYEVLREFEESSRVKLIQRRCSRGLGRQLAFEHSSGAYVIANLDLDDIFLPVLDEIVASYHQKAEGRLLAVFNTTPPPDLTYAWVQNVTLAPRELVAAIGGWRDLDTFEDWDIWSRAEKAGKYLWSTYRFAANPTAHAEPNRAIARLLSRYERYQIRLKLGRRIFSPDEKVGLSQRLAYYGARVSMLFQRPLVGQDPEFKSEDLNLFVNLGAEGVGSGEVNA